MHVQDILKCMLLYEMLFPQSEDAAFQEEVDSVFLEIRVAMEVEQLIVNIDLLRDTQVVTQDTLDKQEADYMKEHGLYHAYYSAKEAYHNGTNYYRELGDRGGLVEITLVSHNPGYVAKKYTRFDDVVYLGIVGQWVCYGKRKGTKVF